MPFRDLVDQAHPVMLLRTAVRSSRVSHAYLFVGPEGVGRVDAAIAFAQLLNCERPVGEDACGECRACRRIAGGRYPDVRVLDIERGLLLDPDDDTKTVIGIKQVRALRHEVSFPPLEGRYKVYIVAGADRMLAEAANSLLKILEEPPPLVVIILIAETTVPLLPTVVSRCQLVRFSLVPTPAIEEALIQRLGLDPGRARFIAALSGGQFGRAMMWAQSAEALEWRDRVLDLLDRLETADPLERMDAAEAFSKDRDRTADLLDAALFWYRDLLVWQETREEKHLINVDRKARIATLAGTIPGHALSARVAALVEAKEGLRSNVHPRLLLENLFLSMPLSSEPATGRRT